MLCPIYVRLMSGNFQGYFYHRTGTTLMCDPPPLIHAQVQYVTSVSHKEWLNSHLKLLFNVPKLYKLNWKIKQNHKSGHTHHNFSPYPSSLQIFLNSGVSDWISKITLWIIGYDTPLLCRISRIFDEKFWWKIKKIIIWLDTEI